MEMDACVGMGGNIVKELVTCHLEGLGAVCLAQCDCAECGKGGGVDGPSVVEECAYDVLDAFISFSISGGELYSFTL